MRRATFSTKLADKAWALGILALIWCGLFAMRVEAQTAQVVRDADRGTPYFRSAAAANAATEKAMAQVLFDFAGSGIALVETNLSYYNTLVPSASDNSFWTNYVFYSSTNGTSNSLSIDRLQTVTNILTKGEGAGLLSYQSTYRIIAGAKSALDTNGTSAAQVQQTVELDMAPLFGFGVFYSGLMEFSDTATLIDNAPVHANSNIYVGSPLNVTFNSLVTTTGTISSPANAGYQTNSWNGAVNYNGTPAPGYLTNQAGIYLPIGTNHSSILAQQILYPPSANEFYDSALGRQRYWNKAQMTIVVSNSFFTVTFKSAPNDLLPYVFSTNLYYLTNTLAGQTGVKLNWLSTTNSFYDWRENKTVNLTQIDVGSLTNWMGTSGWLSTNAFTAAKFSVANPLNIIYVADFRTTNSATLSAVRLVNGAGLPSFGLTVATPNPMYIKGVYNCPNAAYLGTTNTTQSAPASVACDALTILSPSWQDYGSTYTVKTVNSHTSHGVTIYTTNISIVTSELAQVAVSDTVNTAIITGNVPSTGASSSTYSGGVNNLLSLLEDWGLNGSATLTMNTSLVCLFPSTWATGRFIFPGTYYYAPIQRLFSFDQNYAIAAKLPPGTPLVTLPPRRVAQVISRAGNGGR